MRPLSQEFVNSCRKEDGFIMRGENMTRIETFVDAAFAFAITMLIISVDNIPKSVSALLTSSLDIPAFLASAANIGFIWYWHSIFSRRFGLQDGRTTLLSFSLVMLVLIFIYPLKLVFMGLFTWLSAGYLSSGLEPINASQLANLFVYFGIGFLCLSLISWLMNRNAIKLADQLCLTAYERYMLETESIHWIVVGIIALISIVLAKILNGMWITSAGFIYFGLSFVGFVLQKIRANNLPSPD